MACSFYPGDYSSGHADTADMISHETLVLFADGEQVTVSTRKEALRLAFEEYQKGTFIK